MVIAVRQSADEPKIINSKNNTKIKVKKTKKQNKTKIFFQIFSILFLGPCCSYNSPF